MISQEWNEEEKYSSVSGGIKHRVRNFERSSVLRLPLPISEVIKDDILSKCL